MGSTTASPPEHPADRPAEAGERQPQGPALDQRVEAEQDSAGVRVADCPSSALLRSFFASRR